MFKVLCLLLTLSVLRFESARAATCALSHWGNQASSADGFFSGLLGLAVNQQTGQLIASDGVNSRVEFFDLRTCPDNSVNGCFERLAAIGSAPSGVAYANDGSVYLALESANNLVKLDSFGSELSPRAVTTYSPTLVAFDEVFRRVWASSPGSGTIFCYDDNLQPLPVSNITFTQDHPQGLFIRAGFLYVTTDRYNVYKIDLSAPPTSRVPIFTLSQGSSYSPWGIVVDIQDEIFIAHRDLDIVSQYDESGALVSTITLPGSSAPKYLAIDHAGAFLYVSEAGYRVERYGLRRLATDCLTAVEPTTWSRIKARNWRQ